jgi:hypothetical protein
LERNGASEKGGDVMASLEESLVQLKDGSLVERGDIVYERVDHAPAGAAQRQISWKRWKVMETDRATARVQNPDGPGRPTKILFKHLWREKEPEDVQPKPFNAPRLVITKPASPTALPSATQAPVKTEAPARSPSNVDSELEAWLDQGKGLLRDVERRENEVAEQILGIDLDLERIDNRYRPLIEKAQAEVESLKREHADDRALAESRREALDAKLAQIADRKSHIKKMLAGGG